MLKLNFALPPSSLVHRIRSTSNQSINGQKRARLYQNVCRIVTASCDVQRSQIHSETVLEEAALRTSLSESQVSSLFKLTNLLLEASTRHNLTAIRTRDGIIQKHIVDALTLIPFLDNEQPERIIDVGTGAGFPGLVLAIARPHMSVTLVDSVRKKIRFQEAIMQNLDLQNVSPTWGRAEEIGQNTEFREKFDVAVARSVAEMRVLSELTLPLVRVGGCVVAQKSIDDRRQEIFNAKTSFKRLGGTLEDICIIQEDVWRTTIEERSVQDDERRQKALVIVRKKSKSPAKYPRAPGTPKKSPL